MNEVKARKKIADAFFTRLGDWHVWI